MTKIIIFIVFWTILYDLVRSIIRRAFNIWNESANGLTVRKAFEYAVDEFVVFIKDIFE